MTDASEISGFTVPLAGFLGYRISPIGRVFSTDANWRGYGVREMQQTPNTDGYPSVRLMQDGRRRRMAVYKLVALAFLPERPSPSHEVRHLDGDKGNSSYGNLCWGTRKDNAADRTRHGRTSRGPAHAAAVRAGRGY